MGSRALLVEDDEKIVELVRANISSLGLELDFALTGQLGLSKASENSYDIILLDVMLPGVDGLEICRKIREYDQSVPILILSAKGEEEQRIRGLNLGADDYLPKPFSVPEFLARVRALLRRTEWRQGSGEQETLLRAGELLVDLELRKVTVNNQKVELSVLEYDILVLLMRNPGKAFSREQLLEAIWGSDVKNYTTNVSLQVNRLRRKIESDLSKPKFIETVWGHGYRFVEIDENND